VRDEHEGLVQPVEWDGHVRTCEDAPHPRPLLFAQPAERG
jgi:hypothetical protein